MQRVSAEERATDLKNHIRALNSSARLEIAMHDLLEYIGFDKDKRKAVIAKIKLADFSELYELMGKDKTCEGQKILRITLPMPADVEE